MRPSIEQIVIDELEDQKEQILNYRISISNGIELFEDPVLNDEKIIPALEKVIEHYKTFHYSHSGIGACCRILRQRYRIYS